MKEKTKMFETPRFFVKVTFGNRRISEIPGIGEVMDARFFVLDKKTTFAYKAIGTLPPTSGFREFCKGMFYATKGRIKHNEEKFKGLYKFLKENKDDLSASLDK